MAEDIIREMEECLEYHNGEQLKTDKLTDEQKWAMTPGAYHFLENK